MDQIWTGPILVGIDQFWSLPKSGRGPEMVRRTGARYNMRHVPDCDVKKRKKWVILPKNRTKGLNEN